MEALHEAVRLLAQSQRVVVFTGAGVSAESGLATFRGAGGLWEGHRVEDVATPEAFARDPELVWRFYAMRRERAWQAQPNPAHLAIAEMDRLFAQLVVVTQNVDGLHQRAGSRHVLELHGSLWRIRCTRCQRERHDEQVPLASLPPRCGACDGLERPAVVWFGESLPTKVWEEAERACSNADLMLVVGTSGVVWPAAGLVELAAATGAWVVEVNPEPSALAHLARVQLQAKAGQALPALVRQLREA
ncbi:MAG: NAD-dependent deacylase [Thermoanaerobaculum sp.]|nr:NAD-dependent deacylase [Thermoanaerobaculum sp.]